MERGAEQETTWTRYWRDAGVDGCTAAFPPEARDRIANGWRRRLATHAGDTLLDVACGRGAVLAIARTLGISSLTGVDLAEIDGGDPVIMTRIDARRLPFDANSFDVVVSQFGAEYAGLEAAGLEAARVCGARLVLLTHAAEGPVVAHASDQIAQIEWLRDERAVERLGAHFHAPSPASAGDIDRLLAACVARAGESQNVAVLEGFYRTAIALQDVPDPQGELAQLAQDLAAHAERMRTMIAAAPNRDALVGLAQLLEERGFTVTIDDEGTPPIGRWLDARRKEEG
jgi:SAM-dependent methyltransferase